MSLKNFPSVFRLSHKLFSVNKFSTSTDAKEVPKDHEKIKAWQIHSYGGLEELQLSNTRPPIVRRPDDVLVRVAASSINPIDLAMINGYGSVFLNAVRQAHACTFQSILEFPLTLGRDFSGVIIGKGHDVKDNFQIGEEVWGVVPPYEQGAHAEQVVVSKSYVHKKPKNISLLEAGSMLYASVTAWSALKITGDLCLTSARDKNVLVLGGSGGVGSQSVQLLKSWGANVVATCNTDAVPLVESLGASEVVDYSQPDLFEKLGKLKYDIILDCAGLGQEKSVKYLKYLKDYNFSKFITLKSPMLKNFNELGVLGGIVKNAGDLLFANLNAGLFSKSTSVRWGFFLPTEAALKEITEAVENKELRPLIHKSFKFEDIPKAYEFVENGHLRGKVVVSVSL